MTERKHAVWRLDDLCRKCGNRLSFSCYCTRWEKDVGYDSTFCETCDEWHEAGCNDPNCEACPPRPEKPSMVAYPLDYADDN